MKIKLLILLLVPVSLFCQDFEYAFFEGQCDMYLAKYDIRLIGLREQISDYLKQDSTLLVQDSLIVPLLSISRKHWNTSEFNAPSCPSDTIYYRLEYKKLSRPLYGGFAGNGVAIINSKLVLLRLYEMGGFSPGLSIIKFSYPLQKIIDVIDENSSLPKYDFYYFQHRFVKM